MSDDTQTMRRDDAPPATSKTLSAKDAANESMIEPTGDSIVGRTVTIGRPRAELFAYWRDFSNLASLMDNVERVDVIDSKRSHWVVKAPGGKTVEWDSTITDERDGELIAWAADEDADVPNSGRIEFRDAQGDRGTIVSATIVYDPPAGAIGKLIPPAGAIGKLIAKMFQREPAIQARRDLRRFKQLMETGEIATNARTRAELEEEKE